MDIFIQNNTCSYEERIKLRGRKQEVDNFEENRDFFKSHIDNYENDLIPILERYGIKWQIIDTSNLSQEEVHKKAQEIFHISKQVINKSSNSIIVGGMIASGKSSLGKMLAEKFNGEFIDELPWKDPLTDLSLEKLYS